MMKDEHGEVIYVGKASSLRSRVRSYFQKSKAHPPKVLVMLSKIRDVDWIVTDTELEALMLECNLIKRHRPHYNVRLRDDKHYPYLCVTTSEPFPRVVVVRRVKQDGNRYFGPYADSQSMRENMRLVRRVFRIRGCNKQLSGDERAQPCLNHHIGQCDAPCSGGVSKEGYGELVRDVCLFLEGKQDDLAKRLEFEMLDASDKLDFERAARLRDQLGAVKKLAARQKAITASMSEQDIISASAEEDVACVQILFVRAGRLVEQEQFFLDGVEVESAAEWLAGFIQQYYSDAPYVPSEILVSHDPADSGILETWLSERRGAKVRLHRPIRGEKRRLVEMASENAALALRAARQFEPRDAERVSVELEELCATLELASGPGRIEAYDISNTQGREAVGSMVVFEKGLAAKSLYRRFKIRGSEEPDDYRMMREVLIRRLQRAVSGDPKFAALPQLIVIDGGRGQLNAALDAVRAVGAQLQEAHNEPDAITQHRASKVAPLQEAIEGIAVMSLAKRLEEVYLADRPEPLLLPLDSPALNLLRRIRDEAHRFALDYHRNLRAKTSRKSVLDGIPGIGPSRRKMLIKRFASVAGLRRATLDEIAQVPGISKAVAETLYYSLHACQR